MTEKSNIKFRVAICGGGISGLCLAVALSKYCDIDVQVYEAAERFKEIGAGVMIWTRTWQILELMGLAVEFSDIAHSPPDGSLGVGFDYRRSDQPEEGFRFHIVEVPHGCIRFHRAQFLDVFANHLQDGVAHFGKRISSYRIGDGSEGISLQFDDGSSATCDILVGCDGVKSAIRKQLFGTASVDGLPNLGDPVWSGTVAYRGLIPANRLRKRDDSKLHSALQRPMMYCGKSKHVVSYTIDKGNIVNVITFASIPEKEGIVYEGPWVTECSKSELLDCYADWEPEVQDLLQCVDRPTKWALHHLKPLPYYVQGNVVLVGDSAHAMLPHQGAGAGQAIEDAYVLACILGSRVVTKDTLGKALELYEGMRLPAASRVLQGSRESGLMYEFNHMDYGDDYVRLGPAIQQQWDWVWASHPGDDIERELRRLEESNSAVIPTRS